MSKGIELRVGGEYRTRDGRWTVVVGPYVAAVGPSPYRFRGRCGDFDVFYMPDGRTLPGRESDLDIVEEIGADPDKNGEDWAAIAADGEHPVGNPDAFLRAAVLSAFEDPAKWPMTDSERVALLRDLYVMAKGGAR